MASKKTKGWTNTLGINFVFCIALIPALMGNDCPDDPSNPKPEVEIDPKPNRQLYCVLAGFQTRSNRNYAKVKVIPKSSQINQPATIVGAGQQHPVPLNTSVEVDIFNRTEFALIVPHGNRAIGHRVRKK